MSLVRPSTPSRRASSIPACRSPSALPAFSACELKRFFTTPRWIRIDTKNSKPEELNEQDLGSILPRDADRGRADAEYDRRRVGRNHQQAAPCFCLRPNAG